MEDWLFSFAAVNALGSLATVGAFVVLFFKDKNKQAQIDKLAGIAVSLDAQRDVMKQHNDLIEQEVDILKRNALMQIEDSQARRELKELEIKKHKLSVMPKFKFRVTQFYSSDKLIQVNIENIGETGIIKDISSDRFIVMDEITPPIEILKGGIIGMTFSLTYPGKLETMEYYIRFIYTDSIGTNYMVYIKKKSYEHAKADNPVELPIKG